MAHDLRIVPITLRRANEEVARLHRHHKPARGHRFSIGVLDRSGVLRGVAIAGRPVARLLDTPETLEIIRVATDGAPNACSCLYGAMRRIAREMGYTRLITYTLSTEPGVSLRASGWAAASTDTRGRSWDMPGRSRPGRSDHTDVPKTRWELRLGGDHG